MDTRAMALSRAVLIVFLGGVVFGWAAFAATSLRAWPDASCDVLGGPGIQVDACPGYDPWTGQPHGLTVEYRAVPGLRDATPPRTDDPPAKVQGRRVIPFPVGFTIGMLGTLVLLLVTRRRRKMPPPLGSRQAA